ncbi:MAG: PASTA domain-containing protein [Erysipelotrichaceae bacterium]|nr:PASTA domain-containing protein [Erysipelotrichaceae bacterium]
MPDDKNFLDQFSDQGKPASFKEEERIPVTREKRPLNVKALIIAAIVLLVLGILSYFLFLAPKIEMPDFIGKTRSDVAAWVKQQGIETSGVIFDDTYDFDSNEGTILSQSVAPGKKVKNNVKLNFTLSLGPDPEEKIRVPDLSSMTKDEIQEWISSNKLLKTKMVTAYNTEVAENEVIDYSFSGCEEDSFSRGCTLKINVSKGRAPAGKVSVEDFEKKPYASVEAWAKTNKIELIKVEQYSDKIDQDYVISQSIASGKTIKEGDSMTVVVSKGVAVYMPNMIGWSKKQVDAWVRKNPSAYIDMEKGIYSSQAKDIVLKQSLSAGSLIDPAELIELTMSLGNIVDVPANFIGSEYHDKGGLHDWKDQQNELGADISVNRIKEFSDDVPVNKIIRYDNGVYVGDTLNVWISEGRNILLEDPKDLYRDDNVTPLTWADLYDAKLNENEARRLCDWAKITYDISYSYKEGKANGDVISVRRWDNKPVKAGTYLPESITVYIEICDDSYKQ